MGSAVDIDHAHAEPLGVGVSEKGYVVGDGTFFMTHRAAVRRCERIIDARRPGNITRACKLRHIFDVEFAWAHAHTVAPARTFRQASLFEGPAGLGAAGSQLFAMMPWMT